MVILRRAPIIGWCGWTSAQAQLDAHRAMIRKPARLPVLCAEYHAHERIPAHAFRQVATQQDGVDEFTVRTVRGARGELLATRDVGEPGSGRIAVVEIGEDIDLPSLCITRGTFLQSEAAIEVSQQAEPAAGAGFGVYPRFQRCHLLRQQIAVAAT